MLSSVQPCTKHGPQHEVIGTYQEQLCFGPAFCSFCSSMLATVYVFDFITRISFRKSKVYSFSHCVTFFNFLLLFLPKVSVTSSAPCYPAPSIYAFRFKRETTSRERKERGIRIVLRNFWLNF